MILVVGSTGDLGGAIARRLLARGETVRILVRPGSNYRPLVDLGARPVLGDLKDPDSLGPAVEGVDVVVTTANSAQRGGADTVESVDLHGNAHLVDAARAAGVGQFVFISALGADPTSPAPFLAAKGATEQRLRAGDMPSTIIEPTIFMEVWVPLIVETALAQGQPVTLVAGGERHHSWVSRSDVADLAVGSVGNPAAINRTIPIGGPEPVSWRDVIAAYERALGRAIPFRSIALGEALPGFPQTISDLMNALETFDAPIDMRATAETYGLSLTSLASFAAARAARLRP